MPAQKKNFGGSMVALVTPFKDGRIDLPAWRKMVEWQISQGTGAIVVCGTTGECATLSHDEHYGAISAMVQIVDGRIPVIAGAGSNSTAEVAMIARKAEDNGANGVLSVTPYYNKPTQNGLFLHFQALRQATSLPIILYNLPSRTGVNLDPDTVEKISQLGGIDSVKEASGDINRSQELLNRGIRVLSGEDGLTFPLLAMGASGVISVVANFAPKIMSDLCCAALRGDFNEARRLHKIVFSLAKAAFAVTNPIPAKAAMAALGFCTEEYRLPLAPMEGPQREALINVMKTHGLI